MVVMIGFHSLKLLCMNVACIKCGGLRKILIVGGIMGCHPCITQVWLKST